MSRRCPECRNAVPIEGHNCNTCGGRYLIQDYDDAITVKDGVIDRLRADNAALVEVLEFYADPFSWRDKEEDGYDIPDFYEELDFGDRARTALARHKAKP